MKVYEAIKKIEEENGTDLFKVILAYKDGKMMKTYTDEDIHYLRDWIWEVAGYEVLEIRTIGVSGAMLILNK